MQTGPAVKSNPPQDDMPHLRVTLAEIAAVKRQHIKDNLCYTPEEAGAIFGKGAKWAIERVKDGRLIAVDENVKKGRNGLQPSQGIRVTADSVERFRKECEIAPEKWSE